MRVKLKTRWKQINLFISFFKWNNPSFRLSHSHNIHTHTSNQYFSSLPHYYGLCDFFILTLMHIKSICLHGPDFILLSLYIYICYSGLEMRLFARKIGSLCPGFLYYLFLLDFYVYSGKCFKLDVCVCEHEHGKGIYVMNPFLFCIQRKLRIDPSQAHRIYSEWMSECVCICALFYFFYSLVRFSLWPRAYLPLHKYLRIPYSSYECIHRHTKAHIICIYICLHSQHSISMV